MSDLLEGIGIRPDSLRYGLARDITDTIRLPAGSLPPTNHQYVHNDNDGTAVFRTELRQDLSFLESWAAWDSLVPASEDDPCHDMIPIAGEFVRCRLVKLHEAHITVPDAIREAFPPSDKSHGCSAECPHARRTNQSQAASVEQEDGSAARGGPARDGQQTEVAHTGPVRSPDSTRVPDGVALEDSHGMDLGDYFESQDRVRDPTWPEEVDDVKWEDFIHLDGESAETS